MNARVTAPLLSAWLLVPSLALAQFAPGQPPPPQPPMSVQGRVQLYEDVEILRRLLNARLVDEHPPARQMARLAMSDCARCHGGDPRTARVGPTLFRNATRGTAGVDVGGDGKPDIIVSNGDGTFRDVTRGTGLLDFDGDGKADLFATEDDGWLRLWVNNGEATKWTRELEEAHRSLAGWNGGAGLDTEGVYLKGQGVVYTVTLPPPGHDPTAETSPPPSQPISPWDRIRRELHGGKPGPTEQKGPDRKEGSLAEVVLRVLAENGRHFTAELPENESITVVITFRGPRPQAGQPGEGGGPVQTVPPGKRPRVPVTFQQKSGLPPTPPAGTTFSSEPDYELYGDLNLKQGKLDEAVQAYRKALELKPDASHTYTLYRKLAQACLAQGKVEEARQLLDKAVELTGNKSGQPPAATPAAAAHSPLPAKLVVSASRRLLDQVGSGRMTFEEFRKEASVEYLTFPARPE